VEVHAVQLPGRESRYGEPALGDAHEAACLLVDAIESYLDLPYAFFGYSMGALLAFEAVRELRRRGAPMPVQLFVGAKSAPQLPATRPPLAQLPRAAFLRRLSDDYDSPVELWRNSDLLEIVLPVLRADMALCETYLYRHEPPFNFPIQAFCGLRDRVAAVPAVQAWRGQTSGEFALEAFDGAHFFINAFLSRMHRIVNARLQYSVPRAAVP